MKPIIKLERVNKSFQNKIVFENVDLEIGKGELVSIVGASGCGKSTLLNILGLLDKVDSGNVILFDEVNVKPFSRKAEALLRDKIGYLFQNYALIENQSIRYNLELVFSKKISKQEKEMKIHSALEMVGLVGMEDKKIYKCSGGEQQRVALARLLIKPCELILADEPTGNLDSDNKEKVFSILKMMNEMGKTIVLVTHDSELANKCDKVYTFNNKKLV